MMDLVATSILRVLSCKYTLLRHPIKTIKLTMNEQKPGIYQNSIFDMSGINTNKPMKITTKHLCLSKICTGFVLILF